MSLLSEITGALLSQNTGAQESSIASLAKDLLSKEGSKGSIDTIVTALQGAGLGEKVQSWMGTGENEPITEGEIEKSVDKGVLDSIAESTGIDRSTIVPLITSLLPILVDKITPNGEKPSGNSELLSMGASLLGKLL